MVRASQFPLSPEVADLHEQPYPVGQLLEDTEQDWLTGLPQVPPRQARPAWQSSTVLHLLPEATEKGARHDPPEQNKSQSHPNEGRRDTVVPHLPPDTCLVAQFLVAVALAPATQ